MKRNETALFSTPALADTAARKPKKKVKKSTNNYLAEGASAKRRPGAPKGNRNALRHGRRSAAWIARRRALRAHLRDLKQLLGCTKSLRMSREMEDLFLEAINAASARLGRGPP